ncbi:DUF6503 family protein [Pontimicrobium sp. MEBiC01747]
MKNYLIVATLFLALASCKKDVKTKNVEQENTTETTTDYAKETLDVSTTVYPENITKVFNAHGGIDKWNKLGALVFEIEKPDGNEKTTTALKSRKSLIETKDYTLGYNGKYAWLEEHKDKAFKNDPKFYYNLMFYFYAMPFVLGDDGITYQDVEPLVYEGKSYPGIKVSYEKGIGESPDDEYILYYDQETNKMAWLGYTVTYFSKEKSSEFHFIKYSNWQTVNGFVLPAKLEWHKAEGFKIGEKRNEMNFVNISVLKTAPNDSLFEKTENGVISE